MEKLTIVDHLLRSEQRAVAEAAGTVSFVMEHALGPLKRNAYRRLQTYQPTTRPRQIMRSIAYELLFSDEERESFERQGKDTAGIFSLAA